MASILKQWGSFSPKLNKYVNKNKGVDCFVEIRGLLEIQLSVSTDVVIGECTNIVKYIKEKNRVCKR